MPQFVTVAKAFGIVIREGEGQSFVGEGVDNALFVVGNVGRSGGRCIIRASKVIVIFSLFGGRFRLTGFLDLQAPVNLPQ